MSTYLRDQLAGARINLMKRRVAKAWAERQREAASADHPVCEGCGKQHAPENARTHEPAPGPSRPARTDSPRCRRQAPGATRDWWDVLQCKRDASAEVVTAQYRRLRSDHHPDRGGRAERFDEVERAYRAATGATA